MPDRVEDQACGTKRPITPTCGTGRELTRAPGDNRLADLVRDYIERLRPRHEAGLAFYRSLPSLATAAEKAALAIRQNGKRQPHQRRLPAAVLRAVRDRLLARIGELKAAKDFAELLRIVEDSSVSGFGRLAKYDTALRIGCWLRLLPAPEPKPALGLSGWMQPTAPSSEINCRRN